MRFTVTVHTIFLPADPGFMREDVGFFSVRIGEAFYLYMYV